MFGLLLCLATAPLCAEPTPSNEGDRCPTNDTDDEDLKALREAFKEFVKADMDDPGCEITG